MGKTPKVTGQVFEDLYRMHDHFNFHEQVFDIEALHHRVGFLDEELNEIKEAIKGKDAHGVLDGLIDLVVVAVGTIDLAEAKGTEAWKEVMRANNEKQVGFNESRPNSKGVDLVKPEGWKPPWLHDFVGKLEEILQQARNPFNEMADVKIGVDMAHGESTQTVAFKVPGYNYKPGDSVMINDVIYEPKITQEFGKDRAAVQVLQQCIELMRRKAQDYTSARSSVKPVDYYPNGIEDLIYMVDVLKRFRMISVLENMKQGGEPNFDSLEDILMDRIVYLALALEWIRGEMQGQNPNYDIWNRPIADVIITSEN